MSLLLTLGGQKAKKFKKINWDMFYGTPCIHSSHFTTPYCTLQSLYYYTTQYYKVKWCMVSGQCILYRCVTTHRTNKLKRKAHKNPGEAVSTIS